ncbi:CHRD domain-containing protein [Nibrella viscosa]|uniref:CHRD domain-containing protein n=1 Tax=Nibrella viscosa TaxID=1084524 RepID=UPI0031E98386
MKALFSLIVPVLLMAVVFVACKKNNDDAIPAVTTTTYTAALTPAGSRTATSTTITSGTGTSATVVSVSATGTGNFQGVVNSTNPTQMSYTLTYSGLATPVTGAYINSGTSATASGPQAITLTGIPTSTTATSGTATGTATLPTGVVTNLTSNNSQSYVIITTQRFPNGAIGGTITRQ